MAIFIDLNSFAPTIRTIVQSSIEDNFEEEGRFGSGLLGGGEGRWNKSLRAIKQSGKTLQDTGQLAASIRTNVNSTGSLVFDFVDGQFVYKNTGRVDIEVGSNKPYAAIHQFGGTISHPGGTPYITVGDGKARFISNKKASTLEAKGRMVKKTQPHKITIPARPFLTVQDVDLEKINSKFIEWLAKNMK